MSATWSHPRKPRSRGARRPARVAAAAACWLATLAAAWIWPMTVVSTPERVAAFYFVGVFLPAVWLATQWEQP